MILTKYPSKYNIFFGIKKNGIAYTIASYAVFFFALMSLILHGQMQPILVK